MKIRVVLPLQILGVAALLAASAQTSFGAIITTGHFDISGTIYVTAPGASPVVTPGGTCPAGTQCIFWWDPINLTPNKVDISGSGLPNGDIPLAAAGNLAGNIFNLTNPPQAVGVPLAPAPFFSFNNAAISTVLMLNFIDPGFYSSAQCGLAPASGQQCTLPGSLFNFVNNGPPAPPGGCGTATAPTGCQATATWTLEGTYNNGPGQINGSWVGNFTSQFPYPKPYQAVFADLAARGYVENTFSATISLTAVPEPEPATLAVTGGLLLLVGLVFRRRAARAKQMAIE